MSRILQKIIVNEDFVWDRNLENSQEKFLVKLTSKTISELKSNRKELTNIDESCFPELKNEINELKTKRVLIDI